MDVTRYRCALETTDREKRLAVASATEVGKIKDEWSGTTGNNHREKRTPC